MTPVQLTDEYVADHDLRAATKKIYMAAAKAMTRHFGLSHKAADTDRRAVLAWRANVLEGGLSRRSWNTYSNHLRTIWGYAAEAGLLSTEHGNPFSRTVVRTPKRASKTVPTDAIARGRRILSALCDEERHSGERSRITPAWFWLAVFETFYATGVRLNALICIRRQDVDLKRRLIVIRGDTEKTYREYLMPITPGLTPHLQRLLHEAERAGLQADEQLFNVNRFSKHYRKKQMDVDQVEAMYRKLTALAGTRMTPHRFRHTLASDLMKQPERNIHIAKSALNHSNIATTMGYIEADYEHMREVLHERTRLSGGLFVALRDESGMASPKALTQSQGDPVAIPRSTELEPAATQLPLPPEGEYEQTLLFSLMTRAVTSAARKSSPESERYHSPLVRVAPG